MSEKIVAQRTWKASAPGVYGRKNPQVYVKAALTDLGQGSYFSITVDVRSGGHCIGGGADHELAVELVPELAKFVKWHLVNVDRGPMHYIANGLYWAGCSGYCDGKADSPPNWEHFLSTVVWGAALGDAENTDNLRDAFEDRDGDTIVDLLTERLPRLMDAFKADMKELFGE